MFPPAAVWLCCAVSVTSRIAAKAVIGHFIIYSVAGTETNIVKSGWLCFEFSSSDHSKNCTSCQISKILWILVDVFSFPLCWEICHLQDSVKLVTGDSILDFCCYKKYGYCQILNDSWIELVTSERICKSIPFTSWRRFTVTLDAIASRLPRGGDSRWPWINLTLQVDLCPLKFQSE